MQANETVKLKEIHVQQDFFEQIINGFKSHEQETVDFSKAKMPSKMPMVQSMFFQKNTLPILIRVFNKNSFMDKLIIFFDQQRRKQTQGKELQDYLAKWSLIRSVKKQQEQELQEQEIQEDQESRKNILSTLVKAGKTYRKVKSIIRTIQGAAAMWASIRNTMDSQFGRTDFSNQYERASAFSDILQAVSNKQGEIVLTLQKAVAIGYYELQESFYQKLSVGWWRFLYWLGQLILLPDTDSIVDMVAWGLSVAAGIFSMGSGFLAGQLIRVGGTIGKIIVKFASIAGRLFKFTKSTKALSIGNAMGKAATYTNRARNVLVLGSALCGLGKAIYTGIDLYHTDEDDVKQMQEKYTQKSQKWREKAHKAIGKKLIEPLQKFKGDLDFVQQMLEQVKGDLQRSISHLGGGGGAFKFFQKSNSTQVKVVEKITNKPKEPQKDISMSRMDKTLTALAKRINTLQSLFSKTINSIEVKSKYQINSQNFIGEKEIKSIIDKLYKKFVEPHKDKSKYDTSWHVGNGGYYTKFGRRERNRDIDMSTWVDKPLWIYESGQLARARFDWGWGFNYFNFYYPSISKVKERLDIRDGFMDVITATDIQIITKTQAKIISNEKLIYDAQKNTKQICQKIVKTLQVKFGKVKPQKK